MTPAHRTHDKPTTNRKPLALGLAFSLVLVAAILAGVLAGKAYGRPAEVQPIAAPQSLLRARAECPATTSIVECRGKLREAYAAIAWQKGAREHAQAMTVQAITRDAIAWAAARYHVSPADMTSVSECEAHLWPFATNGQFKGAWQLGALHLSDPIFSVVPWQDAYAQASHVARFVKAHGWGQWQCQPGGGLRW